MCLPESLYALIGEFSLNFPKLSEWEQKNAKKNFAITIASSFEEYSDVLINEYKLPCFPDFKQVYNSTISSLVKNAEDLIKKYKLGEFRDVIMENFSLSLPKILNVVESCFSQKHDITKACEVYCKLGYPGYSDRACNEDYLINLINHWVEFAKNKKINSTAAQFELLGQFIQIDSEEGNLFCPYNMTTQKGLWSFFPYSVESINNLTEYILNNDSFFTSSDYSLCRVGEKTEVRDYEERKQLPITPQSICQFIIAHDHLDDPLRTPYVGILASYMELSKYSSIEDINSAVNRIANLLEFVCVETDEDNQSSMQELQIFCVKLVETAINGIFEVRMEDDINNVLEYIFFNKGSKEAPKKLKLNSFVKWELSESGESELVEANDFYRYGDESLCAIPFQSVLSNYYVYLFNKVNDKEPIPLFAVCAYVKWLEMNSDIIVQFLPELHENERQSVLLDYAIAKYSAMNPIPYDNIITFRSILQSEEVDIIDLMYDIKEQRKISNSELIDLWKYIVLDTKVIYNGKETMESPCYLNVQEIDYPETGTLQLLWKYVRYIDDKAFFYHPNHEKGENATLPYIHISDRAKKRFHELSKHILWNFPSIKCTCKEGQIIGIDEDMANYVINTINYICDEFEHRKRICITSSGITANDVLLKYKSAQFQFLEKKQLKGFSIIPLCEKFYSVNTYSYREELALIFTICKNREAMTLVYENVNISRATYIFIIKPIHFENAVNKIKEYFSSKTPNKRSELQFSRDVFSLSDGFLRVIRVVHDSQDNWQSIISFYAK